MNIVTKFITGLVGLALAPLCAHADNLLNCAADDSGRLFGCYVLADHVRIEGYAVNQGECATVAVPQTSIIQDPIRFLALSPRHRAPIVQDLSSLSAMILDHSLIYLDYPLSGPLVETGDGGVIRKMDQLLGTFLLTDGTTFGAALNKPRAAITAKDWETAVAFLADPVLGTYGFGEYFTLDGGCNIQQVTITANGDVLRWRAQ